MKKITFLTILFLLAGGITQSPLFAEVSDDEKILEKGMELTTKFYRFDSAVEEFDKILRSETASTELKIKAYFWIAYSYLSDGKKEKCGETFERMFKFKPEPYYDFTAGLPSQLSKNPELISSYDQEKQKISGKTEEQLKKLNEKVTIQENEIKKLKKSKFTESMIGFFIAIGIGIAAIIT